MWAQALSESMYDLAHTGAQRVAKLCREPSGLACWALELLEEQACMVRSASRLLCAAAPLCIPINCKGLKRSQGGELLMLMCQHVLSAEDMGSCDCTAVTVNALQCVWPVACD